MSTLTERTIRDALRQVIDPEVGINIVDLGLVYRTAVDEGRVQIAMTMTSPACPLGEYLRDEAASNVGSLEGVSDVRVDLVWEPAWTPDMMSPEARRQLGWPGEPAVPGTPPTE